MATPTDSQQQLHLHTYLAASPDRLDWAFVMKQALWPLVGILSWTVHVSHPAVLYGRTACMCQSESSWPYFK